MRRTEVLGLPAVKVGSRRRGDSNRAVELWCARKIGKLQRRLPPEGQLLRTARAVEALVIGYSRQAPQPQHAVELLEQIDELAGPHLPAEVRVRLIRARADLEAATRRPRFAVGNASRCAARSRASAPNRSRSPTTAHTWPRRRCSGSTADGRLRRRGPATPGGGGGVHRRRRPALPGAARADCGTACSISPRRSPLRWTP